jgi:hypothetical protein
MKIKKIDVFQKYFDKELSKGHKTRYSAFYAANEAFQNDKGISGYSSYSSYLTCLSKSKG